MNQRHYSIVFNTTTGARRSIRINNPNPDNKTRVARCCFVNTNVILIFFPFKDVKNIF